MAKRVEELGYARKLIVFFLTLIPAAGYKIAAGPGGIGNYKRGLCVINFVAENDSTHFHDMLR